VPVTPSSSEMVKAVPAVQRTVMSDSAVRLLSPRNAPRARSPALMTQFLPTVADTVNDAVLEAA
jgi:hypothetical protein